MRQCNRTTSKITLSTQVLLIAVLLGLLAQVCHFHAHGDDSHVHEDSKAVAHACACSHHDAGEPATEADDESPRCESFDTDSCALCLHLAGNQLVWVGTDAAQELQADDGAVLLLVSGSILPSDARFFPGARAPPFAL